MAVFSNDPRIQGQWQKVQNLNLLASRQSQCSPTREVVTDLCIGDPEKRRRLGDAGCTNRQTITVKCEDYSGAAAQANADLNKLIAAAAKTKADADKKAADTAAEQAIIARRRDNDAALTNAQHSACSVSVINKSQKENTAIRDACFKASKDLEKNKSPRGSVTFDEIEREKNKSNAPVKRQLKPKPKPNPKPKPVPKPRARR
jgi:hypothetical protein